MQHHLAAVERPIIIQTQLHRHSQLSAPLARTHRHLALANKRDVKKALQQVGRQRPDALFSLPPAALRTLAAAGLPEGMPHERKLTAAAARLQRSCIQGAAGDNQGASLQDMLRVVSAWARPSPDTDSDAEEALLQITGASLQCAW